MTCLLHSHSVGPGRSKSKIKKSDTLADQSQHTISIYMRFETFSNILQQDSSVMARWWIIKCLFRCAGAGEVARVASTLLLHTCITFTMPRFKKKKKKAGKVNQCWDNLICMLLPMPVSKWYAEGSQSYMRIEWRRQQEVVLPDLFFFFLISHHWSSIK